MELVRPTRVIVGARLHRGGRAEVQICPAEPGTGIGFLPLDRSPQAPVPAALSSVLPASRRTVLGANGVKISTVEHLLAALWGLGIADAEVRIRGAEVPILDGSAAPFARELLACSARRVPGRDSASAPSWIVSRAFSLSSQSGHCHLRPSSSAGTVIECTIDFDHPQVGHQHARLEVDPGSPRTFLTRFAPARTFGLLEEAKLIRRRGLARGASLASVLVFAPRGVANPSGTRFRDEPVRHKVVDALGDLALLGGALDGRLRLVRCSHSLLIETLNRAIAAGALVRR